MQGGTGHEDVSDLHRRLQRAASTTHHPPLPCLRDTVRGLHLGFVVTAVWSHSDMLCLFLVAFPLPILPQPCLISI